jgi:hypothetical protein
MRQPSRRATVASPVVTIVACRHIEAQKRTTISSREVPIDRLQRLANKTGAPVAELMLTAINAYRSA